jgi:pSer/pThr/pTyr-binding forkhead associated (FHA) protein
VNSFGKPVSVTSIGIPPVVPDAEPVVSKPEPPPVVGSPHASLIIERGDSPGMEFRLVNDESTIGRWDADNGVFPDVDLDAYDPDAKVSRRHARIIRSNGSYFIEDLGSTNGTYVNRGRRLLPGNSQSLKDGDEVIVGKTFLRFKIAN